MKAPSVLIPSLLAASVAQTAAASDAAPTLEEILVTADFYETNALALPSSVSVIDSEAIAARQAQSLDQLLGMAPNVNYATGASRGRFIQIRGIGERSELIEPVNYSVGVLLDGIDFTGISNGATLMDIDQVEILRGPQGTLYGANALAGLVNMVSNGPGETLEGHVRGGIGNYDSRTLEAAVGGPISDQLGLRVATKINSSDGFVDNTYLSKDDTANIDEQSTRAKLHYQASEELSLGLTVFHADVDNGYDNFSLDNNRKTLSNQPGHDRQETLALGLTTTWQLNDTLALQGTLSHANSDVEYGFDEDWRNPDLCVVESCTWGPDGYHSAFDNYERDNDNDSVDIRLISSNDNNSWVVGIYHRDQNVDLTRTYTSGYGPSSDILFISNYDTKNTAIYGDWTQALTDQLTLSMGARLENRSADYSDNGNFRFDTDEDLWGAQITLSYQLADSEMVYARIARGYKPGGANSNSSVPDNLREYDTETMLNYELGYKAALLDNKLQMQVALFYQDRDDIQTDSAIVNCPGPGLPCTFDDYLTNSATGENLGLELQASYQFNERHYVYLSAGFLDATYGGGYVNYQHVNADEDNGIGVDMKDRDQPHAPDYQYLLGWNWSITEAITADINLEGKDDFLFGNDHDTRSDAYDLVNASVRYQQANWEVTVWGKNLTDEEYQNRAFGTFPNDPRDGYASFGPYYQLSEPRTFGVSGSYSF